MKLQHRIFAVALLLSMDAANSHHSFAPVFDANRTITVAGTVTAFRLVNPHAMMSMDVTDEAGSVVKWTVEFAGRLNLTVGGWTDDTITVGERVSVTGNPTHTGSPRMAFTQLVRADGTELRAGNERFNAIEQERRQRIEQRDQQIDKLPAPLQP